MHAIDTLTDKERPQPPAHRRRIRGPGFWPAVLGAVTAVTAGVYCLDEHHMHGTMLTVTAGCLIILAAIRFEAARNRANARACLEIAPHCCVHCGGGK